MDHLLPFDERVNTVAALCEAGFANQIVLSHDACCATDIVDREVMAAVLPRSHYRHITEDVLPALRHRGVTEDQIDQMLVHNPRDIFSRNCPY
jgi:phosphotriesterase-related protein